MTRSFFSNTFVSLFSLLLLLGCGGGGGSSSGPVAAPAPASFVQGGLYRGTLTETLSTSTVTTEPFSQGIQFTVSANQITLAYAQFSGTSSISPNLDFSIPSGNYPQTLNVNGSPEVCTASQVYAGRFSGTSATGTSVGTIICPSLAETIQINGTFEVALVTEKASLSATDQEQHKTTPSF